MKILVPVDGSKYSMEAIKVAADYAKTKGAEICLINVVQHIETLMGIEFLPSEKERLEKEMQMSADYIIQQACGVLAAEDVIATCRHIVSSTSIPDAIIDYADKEKIDLIIIGSRGLGKSTRFKMGSVASKVVRHAPCSVYVVKIQE